VNEAGNNNPPSGRVEGKRIYCTNHRSARIVIVQAIKIGGSSRNGKIVVGRAQFDVSSRVKVLGKQGLTSHLYRLLQ